MNVRFDALRVALEMVSELRPLVEKLMRLNPKLADEVRRAGVSVVANLAEGSRRRGRDRLHLFRTAAGSANEIEAELLGALAFGHLSEPEIEATLALEDRVQAMLYRLTH